jgi:hypothetical protein
VRIAALAFGILAGLVASLILALSGLDVPIATPDRQAIAIRFGLFVIGNLGMLGAGLTLAAPLAGVIVFILGAAAWIAAALLLHPASLAITLTPPGLLIVATLLAVVAFLRRGRAPARSRRYEADRQPLAASANSRLDPEQFEELPATRVGAGFFGHGGTAMPLNPGDDEQQAGLRGLDDGDRGSERWRPGKRQAPPRQKAMFRDANEDEDEYEDEESGFSRFARGISGLLSFGLYAALAAAAVLIFINLRNGDTGGPAVNKVDVSSSSVAANVNSSSKPQTPVLTAETSSTPPAPAAPVLAASSAPSSAAESIDLLNGVQANPNLGGVVVGPESDAAGSAPPETASSLEPPSSAEPELTASEPPPTAAGTGAVMPWTMPARMAAARAQPAPRRPAAPPSAQPLNTTGL